MASAVCCGARRTPRLRGSSSCSLRCTSLRRNSKGVVLSHRSTYTVRMLDGSPPPVKEYMHPPSITLAATTRLAASARRAPDVIGKRRGMGRLFQREVEIAVRGPVAVARRLQRAVAGAFQLHALLYTAPFQPAHLRQLSALRAVFQRAVLPQVVAHRHAPAFLRRRGEAGGRRGADHAHRRPKER